ncbi:carbohydrate ABC transporter permease [Cellulomonas sp. PhB143]|uniref:carbohydrate ABC transporter permease n=1 Tax=Cellulomonas sp. PhB143 TaxID=2485186 RepID=UPI000F4970E0|nr:sugar ABC transporter permease [Cellulomonas sp. PhB143]ROS78936.1 carbohydrate ABC transporter membrane protein 1 (CUT1 family) [Cellulomonas sp. PhB143]
MTSTLERTVAPPAVRRRPAARRPYRWTARAFVFPAVALCVLLLYVPFVWTTFLSFTQYDGFGSPELVGLDKYAEMFADPAFVNSLLNTLFWVLGTLVLPVGGGLLVAVLVYGLSGSFWYRLPFLVPYAISGVAVGVIWTLVLQTHGALDQVFNLFGVDDPPRWLLDSPLNTLTMIVAAAWQGVGVNALLFTVGLQSIPKEPLEAARLDGAAGWKLFRTMTWPMLTPLTTVVVGLAIVGSLKQFDIIYAMTQGGPGRSSETLALTMYKETFINSDYGLGGAIAVFITVITVIASVIYIRRQLGAAKEM